VYDDHTYGVIGGTRVTGSKSQAVDFAAHDNGESRDGGRICWWRAEVDVANLELKAARLDQCSRNGGLVFIQQVKIVQPENSIAPCLIRMK
jgi:hypothetical protein